MRMYPFSYVLLGTVSLDDGQEDRARAPPPSEAPVGAAESVWSARESAANEGTVLCSAGAVQRQAFLLIPISSSAARKPVTEMRHSSKSARRAARSFVWARTRCTWIDPVAGRGLANAAVPVTGRGLTMAGLGGYAGKAGAGGSA